MDFMTIFRTELGHRFQGGLTMVGRPLYFVSVLFMTPRRPRDAPSNVYKKFGPGLNS